MVAPGLYPRSGPRPTSSEAERTFYRELSAQLPEGWIAWHSLRFRNDSGEEGEGDFVIVAPDQGVLVIEVKGGAIEVRDGCWIQNGQKMEQAPRSQALGFQAGLRRKLEAIGVQRVPWFAVVSAFPDTPRGRDVTEGAVSGALITQEEIPYLQKSLVALANRLLADKWFPRQPEWLDALHGLWCETWRPKLAPGRRAELREHELIQLDRDQCKLLDCLGKSKRMLVTGGPGTGKTLLARELCDRLQQRGPGPQYLCWTRALAAEMRAGGLEGARTIREFAADLLEAAGVAVQDGAPREQWTSDTWNLLPLLAGTEALPLLEKKPDAIVVDEGQDFSRDDWELVREYMGAPIIWAFADSGQAFWDDRGIPEELFPASYELERRYRCPEPLARFADLYREDAAGEPDAELLSDLAAQEVLRVVKAPSESSLPDKVALEIKKATSAGVDPGDIAVLTLGGQTRSDLGVADEVGTFDVVRADDPRAGQHVVADTFLRFKGLERPWIIVTELSRATDRYDVRMHVALTRATVSCVVVATHHEVREDPRLAAVVDHRPE